MASRSSKKSTIAASPHTSDPQLAPFIAASFDPTAYLNSTLPTLGIATAQQPIVPSKATSLPDLVSQTNTQLAQLSAQEARLVGTLTTLTDEILRSGSRLAYEVELLRGEAVGLEEALGKGAGLEDDVRRFVPEPRLVESKGAGEDGDADSSQSKEDGADADDENDDQYLAAGTAKVTVDDSASIDPHAPPALARLRTLQQVRNSLQSVISTFDSALSFPLPPSLLTQSTSAASFVSVAAPADPAQEAAGQEALAKLQASIFDHLDAGKGGEGGAEGVIAAEARLEELKELCKVWKGTSEEKARAKVIEGWEKELQEAKDRLGVKMNTFGTSQKPARDVDGAKGADTARDGSRSRGLFGGLRRLGDKIYLE